MTTPARRRSAARPAPVAATQREGTEQAVSIHQLRVTLKHSRPPIWRQVQVPSDITLYRLQQILQTVLGWAGGHLHQFIVGREY